jgi:hypothetical protein
MDRQRDFAREFLKERLDKGFGERVPMMAQTACCLLRESPGASPDERTQYSHSRPEVENYEET